MKNKILILTLLLIALIIVVLTIVFVFYGNKKVECWICDGTGIRECYMITRWKAGEAGVHTSNCSVCYGQGKMRCNACGGSGYE